jgi:hypothetical protein
MAIYDLYEDECTDVKRSTVSDPMVHCLIGKGAAGNVFSFEDEDSTGIYLQEIIEVEQGFSDAGGMLTDYVVDEYLTRLQDYQWNVTTTRQLAIRPGDFIKFYPKHEAPEELSVISFEKNSDGELQIELGARQPDYSDAWEASQSISNGYSSKYVQESHQAVQGTLTEEFYLNDPTHFSAPVGELTFQVPANVKDADLLPRITLDLSVSAKTEKPLTIRCCALELKTNDTYRRYGNFVGWSPGVEIPTIDITDWITAPGEYTALYDGLTTGSLTLGDWPADGEKLIFVVSSVPSHTDCDGRIAVNGSDEITITLPGTYYGTTLLSAKPTIDTYDLDCNVEIIATIPNKIQIGVYLAEDYQETHAAYTDHPKLTATGTMKFLKRKALA